ncbi:hypothetical protein G3480_16920 [Thiorhodococcus mannitoliphagus]|uniref:Uncharacterized protein n=1 Tax=Thiorhodococcus mannitoliphagus TaxID=329406 RepID=A0A6P1DUG4_9GAMM|nr:hypothetical protein [Thiorhodococcus mannitoliphagus]NEX21967.1 hypothetical protein [Thiorhodococcus mannitoliphagus]
MGDGIRALARSTGLALAVLGSGSALSGEQTAPALWGYGVKTCSAYLLTLPRDETPTALADEDYLRHRQWLAGFVSGLNFAIDRDVLRGAELDAAMLRIAAICRDNPGDDFFNASLRLIRGLGQLKDVKKGATAQ